MDITVGILILSGSAIATGLWFAGALSRRLPKFHPWHDPRYRFRSVLELHQAVREGFALDVATASVDDWLRFPLFSIHQAHALHQLQRSGLSFHCLEDLAAALDVPITQLESLRSALRFTYYEANSPLNCPKLNPSEAEPIALLGIPGMDNTLVDRILNDRRQKGAYRNLADFQTRLQLPSDRLSDLMYYLTFLP